MTLHSQSKQLCLLVKPAGPDCNLRCPYCFYSCKSSLFPDNPHRMSDEVLDKLISSCLRLNHPLTCFTWQGGEPTLMGLEFYQKVIDAQNKYCQDGSMIGNALQTNGILLDDKWCEFLGRFNWLVGISLDGPREYHDFYRRDGAGNGTFERVMGAIDTRRRHKVEFNILVLLNDKNVTAADELFEFFAAEKVKFLQFIPCVEIYPIAGKIAPFSITPQQYGDFLCKTFDLWWNYGPEKMSIRTFDSVMNYVITGRHTECTFNHFCDDYIVVEYNGDAFCCDFFVDEQHRLGNILETPVERLCNCSLKQNFACKKSHFSNKCLVCRHNAICRGGCIKHRIIPNSPDVQPGYFCQAYKQFFDYAVPRLSALAAKAYKRN